MQALVLACFYVRYLQRLEAQVETTPALSAEISSNSVVDPRNPWRWFQFKRRSACRSRSRHAPSEGHQSRPSAADTRSLRDWFTPISRRSVAQSIERSIGPGRQRATGRTKSRSRGGAGTGGASSVACGVLQPANLHDPAELRDLSDHEDPHAQTGYPLHVVPNRERISYIWHQTSARNALEAAGSPRPHRLPSMSSFEAMQVEQLGRVLGRPQLRHFEDTARYEPAGAVVLEEPPVADVGRRTVTPAAEGRPKKLAEKASRIESSTAERTRAVPFNSSRRFSLPSDGFETTTGLEQDDKWGHLNLKGKMMSLLSGWHDGVQPESTSSRATPSGQCEAAAATERPGGLEPRRVSFGVALTGGGTPPRSVGAKELASQADLQDHRPLPAQEVCRPDRTADDAGGLRQDDHDRLTAYTSGAVTPTNTSSLDAEQWTTANSQRVTGRRITLVGSPYTPTIEMGWHSGSFVCSPTKVSTRDSGQQTDP
ncbi:uncharacterized protein LOC119395956 [Rhipicephalus sanguineus]|uniref:uncharacterized protein LOC119395956 n=1 Tax=Rhipicephalus sanguineus TaxID=34632 RepID=UPI0020C5A686|nr:uncharacterized protein LOC119395956 [Rhipicephalus sanguineus]